MLIDFFLKLKSHKLPVETIVVIGARGDRETLRLSRERRDDARMRMSVAHRRIGAHHIDVASAVDVPEIGSLATREDDRQRGVIARAVWVFYAFEAHDE